MIALKPFLLLSLIFITSSDGSNHSNLRSGKGESGSNDEDQELSPLVKFTKQLAQAKGKELSTAADWPWGKKHGVDVSYTVTNIPKGASASFHVANSQKYCKQHSTYGDNDCLFPWDDTSDVTIKTALGFDMDDTYKIQGKVKVDYLLHLNFECPVCGENCTVTVPKIDYDVILTLPPCPIDGDDFTYTLENYLPDPAFVPPVVTSGEFSILDPNDKEIASAEIKINVAH
uniref:MD-2-related lipid-recognition domain-containing protein n=1 Tax=Ditylum brightwellii TaxID=49249 RepID=A0A6V2KN96_9STRA|mmetsp:Transcript_5195/g.6920  ORF Transcript_5195/g.6920 Transcript_5195/m.6920 type:complete len:230 (+) Transcript_5195:130-819(+)